MINFQPAVIFKKIPKRTLGLHIFRLFLIVVIFLIVPSIGNLRLGFSQPLNFEEAVIEVLLPSPSPSPSPIIKLPVDKKGNVVLDTKTGPTVKVDSKNSSSLCEGVTESWKLVANPEVEGQYIICNSETGQMATVDELNIAQNNFRADHGLNRLLISGDLCKIATERAWEVADNFSHDGFEAAIEKSSIQKSAVGENIASGPLTAVQFVEWSWNMSPGHRANMLGDWSEGCGGVFDRFAVFIFAK